MKKLLILLTALLVSARLFAQIDPTVVIDREFEGQIDMDARMPLAEGAASIADSLKVFDVSFDYSIFNRPFRDLYEFSPYQAASLGVVPMKPIPHFHARVASQYPFMPELDFYGQMVPKKNPNINVGMYVKYASEVGRVPSMHEMFDKLDVRRSKVTAGADFKYAWDKGELNLDASYRYSAAKDMHEAFATFPKDSARHSVNAFDVDFKIRSTNTKDKDFYYDIDASLSGATKTLGLVPQFADFSAGETALNIDALFGSSFEEHRMYVDVRTQNIWYTQLDGYYMGIIEFTPIYRYAKGRFDGRFGICFSNSFTGDNMTSIYPDVDMKLEVLLNKLWVRAVANGGRNIDWLGLHYEAAPWLMMGLDGSKQKYTTRPVDAKIAVEGIIGSRFGLNVYGTYTSYKNKMLLYSARFDNQLPYIYPEFADYVKMSAGMELTWTSKDLRLFATVQGNKYNSSKTLYMLPAIESITQLEYNFKERLYLSAGLVIQGSRISQLGDVPTYLDLSAKAEFKVNRFLSVYAKGGNLLNRENYYFAGIARMPVNVGGGICLDF